MTLLELLDHVEIKTKSVFGAKTRILLVVNEIIW
jgi:hypothetical protein